MTEEQFKALTNGTRVWTCEPTYRFLGSYDASDVEPLKPWEGVFERNRSEGGCAEVRAMGHDGKPDENTSRSAPVRAQTVFFTQGEADHYFAGATLGWIARLQSQIREAEQKLSAYMAERQEERCQAAEQRMGFDITLTPEAAEQLRGILDNPGAGPRPAYEPKSVPVRETPLGCWPRED